MSDERWTLALMLLPVLMLAMVLAGGKAIKPHLETLVLPTVSVPTANLPNWVVSRLWPPTVVRPPVVIAYRPSLPVLAPLPVSLRRTLPMASPVPAIGATAPMPLHPVAYVTGHAGPAFSSVRPLSDVHYSPLQPADLVVALRPTVALRYPPQVPPAMAVIATDLVAHVAVPVSQPPSQSIAAPSVLTAALAIRPDHPLAYPTLPPLGVPDIMEPGWPSQVPPPVDRPSGITEDRDGLAGVCRPARLANLVRATRSADAAPRVALDATSFGYALAEAAEAQTREFGFYTAEYQRIAYPRGDVAPMHGACSDVIIRAYRSLGIDLQEHVQRARVGSGDSNIDHRRTETLRKLFERFGASLTVTEYPENYRPGDIVTYYRPHSRVSRAHIAIVSKQMTASGRPLIVHNRGWGAQLEDALFADKITGHYRLSGVVIPPEATPVMTASRKVPAVTRLASQRRRATP